MKIPWDEAVGRTKRHYLRKARQVVFATLEEIAPNNSDPLLRAVKERQLHDNAGTDYFLLEALMNATKMPVTGAAVGKFSPSLLIRSSTELFNSGYEISLATDIALQDIT